MQNENTNTINVNMDNLSTEERTQLLALIEKANKPQEESGLWKPDDNEEYWFIYPDGSVNWLRYNKTSDIDNQSIAIGNCFRTKEEAEFVVERLKVLQELRELADGYKFKHGIYNYTLGYNYQSQKVESTGYCFTLLGSIYFESEKAIENAINTIGEERLKKYYFCIEE